MEQMLPPTLDVTYTTDWAGPLDGLHMDREMLQGFGLFPWQIVSRNSWWSRRLKKGEIGCAISHWRCWKDAADRNACVALMLEDDVVLVESFFDKVERALHVLEARDRDWDFLYLGRQPAMRDFPAGDGFVRPGYTHCTYAYMLSRSGIGKVLSVGFENHLIPLDEFLSALFVIHPRPDVARRYRPILKAFALEPPIAFQLPKEHGGSDTEATDFVDWQD